MPTPARMRSGFCSTGSASATKASSPSAISHRTSSAQATIASPRWAAGGPSGGAGSRKSVSNASPAARTAGIAGSVKGSVSNRDPFASTHSSVWLVSVVPEPLRCVSLLRCSTNRRPTSRITAPRAWTASVAWTLSLPSITPPTTMGPVSSICPTTCPELGFTSSGMDTPCSGCEPDGPASLAPLIALNGSGAPPEWPR